MGVCVGCGSTEHVELHVCPAIESAAAREIAALRSELQQVKAHNATLVQNDKQLRQMIERANARTQRAIKLREYVNHPFTCFVWQSRHIDENFVATETCDCGLADLLRELDAEESTTATTVSKTPQK